MKNNSGLIVKSLSCLGMCVGLLSGCGGGFDAPLPPIPAEANNAAVGAPNVAPIYIDEGLHGKTRTIPNMIYVDLKVCQPGSATQCAVIDHVLVDTGSIGLRIFANMVPSGVLGLLPKEEFAGKKMAECYSFVSGTTWGGVRKADVRLGGKDYDGMLASSMPIHLLNDSDPAYASVPASCSGQGGMFKDAEDLGAKGILGIGVFKKDCGAGCESKPFNVYYTCSAGGACEPTRMPLDKQVPNPIASWAPHDNGSTIWLPSIGGASAAKASGLLIVGIATATNNVLQPNAQVLGASEMGAFTSVVNGNTLKRGYLDSGSTVTFMPASGDVALDVCAKEVSFFCPRSPVVFSARNEGVLSTKSVANFQVVNASSILFARPSDNAFAGLAGPTMAPHDSVYYGASFFFGRHVSTLVEDKSAAGFAVKGPAFAHTP